LIRASLHDDKRVRKLGDEHRSLVGSLSDIEGPAAVANQS